MSLPNLAEHRRARFLGLMAMYISQGLPFGFVATALQDWFSAQGLSEGTVGPLVATALLPWSFKIIWGPLIDRWRPRTLGVRRGWVLLAQVGMIAATALCLVVGDPMAQRPLLTALLFVQACFASLQDVAIDAMAVELVPPEERARANAAMFVGQGIGLLLGAAALAQVLAYAGFRAATLVELLLLTLAFLAPLLLRERAQDSLLPFGPHSRRAGGGQTPRLAVPSLLMTARALLLPSSLLFLAFQLIVRVVLGAMAVLWSVEATQHLGWQPQDFSGARALAAGAGGGLGLLAGGLFADARGHHLAVRLGLAAVALPLGLFALWPSLWGEPAALMGFFALTAFLGAFAGAGVFALAMSLTWPPVAGTQFAVYMAAANVGLLAGEAAAGPIAETLALEGLLGLGALLGLVCAVVVGFIDPDSVQRRMNAVHHGREEKKS